MSIMDNALWDKLYYNRPNDTSNSNYTEYVYRSKYQREFNREHQTIEHKRRVKNEMIQRVCDLKSVVLPDPIK